MSIRKNKKDILDIEQSLDKALGDYHEDCESWSYSDYDEFDNDFCDCSVCTQSRNFYRKGWSECVDWDYDPDGGTKWARKIDLDSVSPERKRNRIINTILGIDGEQKNTIENIINSK